MSCAVVVARLMIVVIILFHTRKYRNLFLVASKISVVGSYFTLYEVKHAVI